MLLPTINTFTLSNYTIDVCITYIQNVMAANSLGLDSANP